MSQEPDNVVPLRELSDSLPGYDLLELLSRGGQGVVILAEQRSTRRQVALKVMHQGVLSSDQQIRRFEREVELIARLRHPNIVHLYDSGVAKGRHYYAMEFIDGQTLDQHVVLNDIRPKRIIGLVIQIAKAVGYAHQNGVIHRDLKPTNVLIDEHEQPRVCDFGLAAMLDETGLPGPHTHTGQVVGTLPYLSPEQAGGFDGRTDVRSDVYSLAVMLYELLTDDFPYSIDGPAQQVRTMIIDAEPTPIRSKLAGQEKDRALGLEEVNRDLELILAKALAKRKEDRYQSMDAFAADLGRYLEGEAIEARAPTWTYVLGKFMRKHQVAASGIVATFATLAISSAILLFFWADARHQRNLAIDAARTAYDAFGIMLDDVDELVRALPGGLAVRNELLGRVEGELPKLSRFADDLSLTELHANLSERAGDLAADEGRDGDAREHYIQFLTLASSDYADGKGTARVLSKLADLSQTDEAYSRALASLSVLPTDAEVRFLAAETHQRYGNALRSKRQYGAAEQQFSKALEQVLESDSSLKWRRLEARVRAARGRVRIEQGQYKIGRDDFEASLRIRTRLLYEFEDHVGVRRDYVESCRLAGSRRRSDGDLQGAIDLFIRGVEEGRWLVQSDPRNRQSHRDLLYLYEALVSASLDRESTEEAREYADRAVQIVDELVGDRIDAISSRMRAETLVIGGRVCLRNELCDDALDRFVRAQDIFERLHQLDTTDRYALRESADTSYWIGATLKALDDLEGALVCYRRASSLLGQLADDGAGTIRDTLDYCASQVNLAATLITAGDNEAYNEAWGLLCDAEASLVFVLADDLAGGLVAELRKRIDAVAANHAWIAGPGYSGSLSGGTSTGLSSPSASGSADSPTMNTQLKAIVPE